MPDSLPIWDLTDLYTDSSTSIQLDLDTANQQTQKLVQHQGRLSQMTVLNLQLLSRNINLSLNVCRVSFHMRICNLPQIWLIHRRASMHLSLIHI